MSTVAEPRNIYELPVLDEDDVCHIANEFGQTPCGAHYDCPAETERVWLGQEVCTGCGRLICPACSRKATATSRSSSDSTHQHNPGGNQ